MFIKQIVIEGALGDVEIRRTDEGAIVIANDIEVEVARESSRDDRYFVAWEAAKVLCGATRSDEPNATNSMIHDVLNEIERVAGC